MLANMLANLAGGLLKLTLMVTRSSCLDSRTQIILRLTTSWMKNYPNKIKFKEANKMKTTKTNTSSINILNTIERTNNRYSEGSMQYKHKPLSVLRETQIHGDGS